MKLFQIQKTLFTSAVSQIQRAFASTTDPMDTGQYLVLSLNKKSNSLRLTVTNQDIAVRIEIDNAGDAIKVEEDGVFVVKGETLFEVLTRSEVLDKITVNFDAKKDVIKPGDPSVKPIELSGNLALVFPGDEVWEIPVLSKGTIDVPTDPVFDTKAAENFTVQTGEFKRFVEQVSMACGNDKGDPRFRNALVRVKGQRYELVTTTGAHLAWAKATHKGGGGDFQMCIPHSQTILISKIADLEQDLKIVYNKGKPGTSVACQGFVYGDKPVGEVSIRATCSTEKFASFDALIEKLDFILTIKMKTQQARPACDKLDLFKNVAKASITIDTKKGILSFSKKEDGRVKVTNISIPITVVEDKSNGELENLDIGSPQFVQSIHNAIEDEIIWKFSGRKSLTCMVLSPQRLEAYFAPFNDEVSA